MDVFLLVLQQMLMMFLIIAVGYFLAKKKLIPEKTGTAIAKLETYFFVPCLSFSTQLNRCTPETFRDNGTMILFGLGIGIIAVLIGWPLSRLFIRDPKPGSPEEYQRNIYWYSLSMSNYGYMGNFIIKGIWGEDGLYRYMLFTFFIGILIYGWGMSILIPKGQNDKSVWDNIKRGLLTPPFIAVTSGILCGLIGLRPYVPEFVMTAMTNAGNCMGPCAMLLAGIMIGSYSMKDLVTNKKIYLLSFLRLILIPAVFVTVLKLIGVREDITLFALIAFCCPLGLNTIVFPAAYGGETRTGASMTLVSSVLAVITIPVMYLIFNVLWV